MIKRMIGFYKRKQKIKKGFLQNAQYFRPGKYTFDDTFTLIHLKEDTSSSNGDKLARSLYENIRNNHSFFKNIFFSIFKAMLNKNLEVKRDKNTSRKFLGTVFLPNANGKGVKIFNFKYKKILIEFTDKQEYRKKLGEYKRFSRHFPMPTLHRKNNRKLHVVEEYVEFKRNDSWTEKDYNFVLKDIFKQTIRYLKNYPFKKITTPEKMKKKIITKEDDPLLKLIVSHISKDVMNLKIPIVQQHGDLWASNILISDEDKKKTYYIDWEHSGNLVFFFDIFFFMWMEYFSKGKVFYFEDYMAGKYDLYFKKMFHRCGLQFSSKHRLDYMNIFFLNNFSKRWQGVGKNNQNIYKKYKALLKRLTNVNEDEKHVGNPNKEQKLTFYQLLISKFKLLFESSFSKSVLLLVGGTATAQILNVIFLPIITRLYSPEEYGVLTAYSAILGLLTLGSLEYNRAIPIGEDDEQSVNILALSIIILCSITLMITLNLFFFGEFLLGLIGSSDILLQYKYLISLGVFTSGLYMIFMQWSLRKKEFKAISKTKVMQSLSGNGTKVGLGLYGLGPVGLILGGILKTSTGITTLAKSLFTHQGDLIRKINIKDMIWCAIRFKNFPFMLAPSQIIKKIGNQLPILFIAGLYGSAVVGSYGLALGIVNLPMTLIGTAVGDVFYAEVANTGKKDPKRIKSLSLNLFKKLFLIGLLPLITLLLFGPILFSFVFGDTWYEAGVYSRAIAILVFSTLIFSPLSRIYEVFERQKEQLILNIIKTILILITFWTVMELTLNSYWAVTLSCLTMSFVYFLIFFRAMKILDQEIVRKEISS